MSLGDEALDLGMASKLLQEQIKLQRLALAQNAAAAALAPIVLPEPVGIKKKTGKRVSKKSAPATGGVEAGGTGSAKPALPGGGKGLGITKVVRAKKPDLLLVEDVRVSQRIGEAALRRAQYKVALASDGQQAVDSFKQYQDSLEVVLMDIHMPGMNGIEATELIRQFELETVPSRFLDMFIAIMLPIRLVGLTPPKSLAGERAEDHSRAYRQCR
jgi:hypothetical protein